MWKRWEGSGERWRKNDQAEACFVYNSKSLNDKIIVSKRIKWQNGETENDFYLNKKNVILHLISLFHFYPVSWFPNICAMNQNIGKLLFFLFFALAFLCCRARCLRQNLILLLAKFLKILLCWVELVSNGVEKNTLSLQCFLVLWLWVLFTFGKEKLKLKKRSFDREGGWVL